MKPPRSLFVDRPLGFPLGMPNHPVLQKKIIIAALRLLEDNRGLPFIEDFVEPDDRIC